MGEKAVDKENNVEFGSVLGEDSLSGRRSEQDGGDVGQLRPCEYQVAGHLFEGGLITIMIVFLIPLYLWGNIWYSSIGFSIYVVKIMQRVKLVRWWMIVVTFINLFSQGLEGIGKRNSIKIYTKRRKKTWNCI